MFFEIEFFNSVKYKMTGVRAGLKRILRINPETPGTMRYPKKSWSLLIPPPCLPRSVRLPMCPNLILLHVASGADLGMRFIFPDKKMFPASRGSPRRFPGLVVIRNATGSAAECLRSLNVVL